MSDRAMGPLPLPVELAERDDLRCVWKGEPLSDYIFDVLGDVLHAIRVDTSIRLTLWNDRTGAYVMVTSP